MSTRSSRIRTIVLASLLLSVPLLVTSGKRLPVPAGIARAGVVSASLPNVTIQRDQLPATKAEHGSELAWSDVIRTDGNGRARVRLINNSILSIGEGSELRIEERDPRTKRTVIELKHGALRTEVDNTSSDEIIEVRTPTGIATISRGDFVVDATTAGEATFICLKGTVQITARNTSVDCKAGRLVIVDEGTAPYPPQLADATLMAYWQNTTDPEQTSPVQYFP